MLCRLPDPGDYSLGHSKTVVTEEQVTSDRCSSVDESLNCIASSSGQAPYVKSLCDRIGFACESHKSAISACKSACGAQYSYATRMRLLDFRMTVAQNLRLACDCWTFAWRSHNLSRLACDCWTFAWRSHNLSRLACDCWTFA